MSTYMFRKTMWLYSGM